MSGYIEKDLNGEYFNDASGTIPVNPGDSPISDTATQQADENLGRWNWLISGWKNMSFKERMSIFMPYLHYVNPRDNFKKEFDDKFQSEMIEWSYKLCRPFEDFKFDPDGKGVPNLIMVYGPVSIDSIPDADVKSDIKAWGEKYGFISKSSSGSGGGCCPCENN